MDAEQQMVAAAEKPKVLAQVRHARILETLARKGAVYVSDVKDGRFPERPAPAGTALDRA